MRSIDLPPFAPMLIESTRAIGYSTESAIADVIDNSITAKATNVAIEYLPWGEPYIAIADNGSGMSEDKLTESMRYGSADPTAIRDTNDMGRYGLGMKTASLSQCRCLTVVSKQQDTIVARRWDLDYIKETGSWSLIALEFTEIETLPMFGFLSNCPSGTVVIWSKLDKTFAGESDAEQAMTEKMDLVSKHLSLVFHRFFKGGDAETKVFFLMNGSQLEADDPFFTTKSRVIMETERVEISDFNCSVDITPFVLPHPSMMTKTELEKYGGTDGMRKRQGFYVYRNKRLLIWGTWFRLTKKDEFSKLARVRIDIPNNLDELWTLDVKKSVAVPPEIVKIRLRQIIKRITDESKRPYTFRGRQETRDGITHVWNVFETREGVRYEINNDHPLFERLSEMIDDEAKKLLDEYIYSIANNFPINRLHNDIFNEKKIVKDSTDAAFENVKEQFLMLLQLMPATGNSNEIVDNLIKKVEPFCDYADKIRKIAEEELNK